MIYLIIFLVGFASFTVSVFTFSQIKGSIQYRHIRGPKMTAITILINSIIILLAALAVLKWLNEYKTIALIGAIIGLLVLPKNIE